MNGKEVGGLAGRDRGRVDEHYRPELPLAKHTRPNPVPDTLKRQKSLVPSEVEREQWDWDRDRDRSELRVSNRMYNSPGVRGGEQQRVQSPPARISDCTSPSQPSFTPSMFSRAKKGPVTGVGRTPQVDGGLLMALPDTERGGVEG